MFAKLYTVFPTITILDLHVYFCEHLLYIRTYTCSICTSCAIQRLRMLNLHVHPVVNHIHT